MAAKFQNKYRIESARLASWNYASEGMYYITICTKNRIHYFGEIKDGIMILSEMGNVVQSEWLATPEIRPDMNLSLGEFIIMPDHFHAILIIGKNEINSKIGNNDRDALQCDNDRDASQCDRDASQCDRDASQCDRDALQCDNDRDASQCVSAITANKFGPQSKNLSSVIRGFKGAVTTYARKNMIQFDWQSRFYDHIIRSEMDFNRISKYIRDNIANWGKK